MRKTARAAAREDQPKSLSAEHSGDPPHMCRGANVEMARGAGRLDPGCRSTRLLVWIPLQNKDDRNVRAHGKLCASYSVRGLVASSQCHDDIRLTKATVRPREIAAFREINDVVMCFFDAVEAVSRGVLADILSHQERLGVTRERLPELLRELPFVRVLTEREDHER